jgi:hypothetical protein
MLDVFTALLTLSFVSLVTSPWWLPPRIIAIRMWLFTRINGDSGACRATPAAACRHTAPPCLLTAAALLLLLAVQACRSPTTLSAQTG